MLMMRLQRVGRRNDPSYRIVVTDKRTGVKSDKHVDRLGSYNPKTKQFQLDADKARDWLSKGVQPSDTLHNLLISKKVIEGKKINVLPRKSPIIDEEAEKAKEEAAAAAEAEAASTEEAPAEETAEETPAEEEVKEEAPAEEAKEEEKSDDIKVEIEVDEASSPDNSEIAEENPEEVEKEQATKAQAEGDAQGD